MFLSLMGDSALNWIVTQKALQLLLRPPWLPETVVVSQGQRLIFLGAGLPRGFAGTFGTGFGLSQRWHPSGPGWGRVADYRRVRRVG